MLGTSAETQRSRGAETSADLRSTWKSPIAPEGKRRDQCSMVLLQGMDQTVNDLGSWVCGCSSEQSREPPSQDVTTWLKGQDLGICKEK